MRRMSQRPPRLPSLAPIAVGADARVSRLTKFHFRLPAPPGVNKRPHTNAQCVAHLQSDNGYNGVDNAVRATSEDVAHDDDRCCGEQNGNQEEHSECHSTCRAQYEKTGCYPEHSAFLPRADTHLDESALTLCGPARHRSGLKRRGPAAFFQYKPETVLLERKWDVATKIGKSCQNYAISVT